MNGMLRPVIHALQLHGGKLAASQLQLLHEMLAIIGMITIVALLALILSNRVSPIAALILVPLMGAGLAGQGAQVPAYVLGGIGKIAPVAGMFVFAILFFGLMTDAGLLAPIVKGVLRIVGERPARITVGTALLALLIHLDGSGAVCFLVTIPALRPLYDRLGMVPVAWEG